MRRLTLPLLILGCIALAALLTWVAVSGSFGRRPAAPAAAGTPAERTISQPLPPFRKIEVSGSADVTLVQGDAESVALPAEQRVKGTLRASVRDGTLYVESKDHAHWWDLVLEGGREQRTPIVISLRELDAIVAAGTVKVTAATLKADDLRISGAGGTSLRIDDLTVRELKLVGAGALRADLAGRATDTILTISGAGEFRGAKFVTQNATVTVAGAGKVIVNAEKTLKATISGAGTVEYLGNPDVTERISGAGRVRRRDAASASTQVALAD
ncbi:MAG: head GIN domain-containing protein [Burkholderiales bacterium]